MTLALLCSGQGQQSRAMFDLFGGVAAAQSVIATAGHVLGRDVAELLAQGSDAALQANRTGQILCVARALAAAASLPLPPVLVAGYSVGEMAAWGIAGCWSGEETLRLTSQRAALMDSAGGDSGGLGFIRGLDRARVEALTEAYRCAIAILNPDHLFIIGGAREDVMLCCTEALAQGAAHARPIPVMVASHTVCLSAAVEPFEAVLRSYPVARPLAGRTLLASNGSIVTDVRGLPALAAQVATCIDWAMVLEALVERGATRMLELGSGTALAVMARGAYPHLDIRAIDEFQGIEGVSRWIGRG